MSLTIQAPHANMNAYEIGDDETRKNKVSDKGTIYAGDLQFAHHRQCCKRQETERPETGDEADPGCMGQ